MLYIVTRSDSRSVASIHVHVLVSDWLVSYALCDLSIFSYYTSIHVHVLVSDWLVSYALCDLSIFSYYTRIKPIIYFAPTGFRLHCLYRLGHLDLHHGKRDCESAAGNQQMIFGSSSVVLRGATCRVDVSGTITS